MTKRALTDRAIKSLANHPAKPGKTYDVPHPETIAIGRDTFIYYFRQKPDQPFDRVDMVSLLLVQNIEHLDQGTADKQGKKK